MSHVSEPAEASIDSLLNALIEAQYICDQRIATALFLAIQMQKPILVEGPPGVGKTELAKASAQLLERPLIRLQCYEGLDESKALYEWKYGKQLLYTQVLKDQLGNLLDDASSLEESVQKLDEFGDLFFSPQFLEPRPLLKALQHEKGSVLLIDEVDKSDHEFEAFLLEMLSDYQVSIPEIGTLSAVTVPLVILTSNHTRELSEPLRRRCLHLQIPLPSAELEGQIIQTRIPEIPPVLKEQVVAFLEKLRGMNLSKQPAVSESLDWARALLLLQAQSLDLDVMQNTLNVLLKQEEDIQNVTMDLDKVLEEIIQKQKAKING